MAYTKENKIDKEIDITPIKEMEDVEIETDEKSLFGITKTKTVRQWTGNIVLSEKDYLKLRQKVNKGKQAEGKLEAILETDVYQENKELKNELKDQIDKNDKDIFLFLEISISGSRNTQKTEGKLILFTSL